MATQRTRSEAALSRVANGERTTPQHMHTRVTYLTTMHGRVRAGTEDEEEENEQSLRFYGRQGETTFMKRIFGIGPEDAGACAFIQPCVSA
jgi:hypothetical protein